MKDESRAKWPEGMTGLRIREGNNRLAYLIGGNETTDAMVWSEDTDIIEARAKQVRALPAMVALLKEIHKDDGFYDGQENWQPNCFVEKARVLLRAIGEIG